MRVRALSLFAIGLCGYGSACGHPSPTIKSFHVTPTGYCASGTQKIHIDWDTDKGETTLEVSPDDARPQVVSAKGMRELPAHDVVVTLRVSKGALAPHVIQPVRAVNHHSLNGLALSCKDGWVRADPTDFGGSDQAFASEVHPEVISNKCARNSPASASCHRDVRVTHAGKTWEIAPDSLMDLGVNSLPMNGDWVLEQKLIGSEQCGSESAAGALEIDLELEAGCTKGAAYEQ
jgi:hypothetical protein